MRQVEICVEGHLDPAWAEWLDGFSLTHTEKGETVLTGKVKDQAALYGLIAKLRDLGLKLLSVYSVQAATGNDPLEIPSTNQDEREDVPDGNTDDC